MKRWIVLSMLAAQVASADPRHVLVLRSDGNADAATRGKVDTQVLKLAKNLEGTVDPGDISFSDASAAVGCMGSEAQCRDDVLQTMGVDEVIATSVSAAPSGELKITVRRIAKGSPTREVVTTVPAGQAPDAKMNAEIGPMFGVVNVVNVPTKEPPPPPPPPKDTPPPPPPPVQHPAPPTRTAEVTAAPNGVVAPPEPEGHGGGSRLELAGMVAGGGFVVLGIVMWSQASSTESDIKNLPPPKSPNDFRNLTGLEGNADTYATVGNVMFFGGIALGAVSGYLWWKDRRADRDGRQARIVPTLFPHGGGVAFTIGGAP